MPSPTLMDWVLSPVLGLALCQVWPRSVDCVLLSSLVAAAILIAGVYGGMVVAGKVEPGEMAVETLPYGLIQGELGCS